MRPIRVFVLDDHELVRRGLAHLLDSVADIEVVGEAATAAQALRGIAMLQPDVAVLDARLPDGSGIDVCREIASRSSRVRCLILTSYDDEEALFTAVMAGAAGYLLKQIEGSSLVDGIREIAAGRSLLDPVTTAALLARLRAQGSSDGSKGLSPRELEMLDLIAQGCTNRQIAERLFLAEKTVKNNVSVLLAKLGLQRRTQAAAYASRMRRHR